MFGKIYYKVVTLHNNERRSFVTSFLGYDTPCINYLLPYDINYPKGKIVNGIPKTFGIFCFKTFKLANEFLIKEEKYCLIDDKKHKIIKVMALSFKSKTPEYISNNTIPSGLDDFYRRYKLNSNSFYKNNWESVISAPEGTICFDKVLVLT